MSEAWWRRTWVLLLACLLLAAVPMVVRLGGPDATDGMEKLTLNTARDTMRAVVEGDGRAWLVPRYNDRERLVKPPGALWVTMLAWAGLDPATADGDALVWRGRLAAVAVAMLAVAGTFWAGHSIGGTRLAVLSAVTLGTMIAFARQARYANYDTHLMGWATLSVAAGLWAIGPRAWTEQKRGQTPFSGASWFELEPPPGPWRWWGGWPLAGVLAAMAVLAKGPIALLFALLPLGLAVVLAWGVTQRGRWQLLGGLALACGLAVVCSGWWHAAVALGSDEGGGTGRVLRTLLTEYRAEPGEGTGHRARPAWHYVIFLAMVFPWPFWLVGGLIVPWQADRRADRRRLLIAWVWGVVLLAIMSIPESKRPRYVVPLLPPAALLIGQLCDYAMGQVRRGLKPTGVAWLTWPHWILMGAATVGGIGLTGAGWTGVIDDNVTRAALGLDATLVAVTRQLAAVVPTAAVLALYLLAAAGTRWHLMGRPGRALAATAAWSVVVMSLGFSVHAGLRSATNPDRDAAQEVRRVVAADDLYVLESAEGGSGREQELLAETARLYAGRPVYHQVNAAALRQVIATTQGPLFVALPEGAHQERGWLEAAGWREVARFDVRGRGGLIGVIE